MYPLPLNVVALLTIKLYDCIENLGIVSEKMIVIITMTDARVLTVILDSLTITATSLSILHKNSTLPVIIPSANH